MDIKKFRKKYHLSNADIIRIIQYKYPRFGKYPMYMCVNSKEFGVQLTPGAEDALYSAVNRKKDNRKKSHQLTVRVDDSVFNGLKEFCEMNHVNIQDTLENAILYYCFGE